MISLNFVKRPMRLVAFSALMSIVNLLFYNIPFFTFVWDNSNAGTLGKVLLTVSFVLVMLLANFFACYLMIFLFRIVGKVLIAICHLISATAVYFVYTYNIFMDESMIGNVFNTRYSEASGFMTPQLWIFILVFGVLPAVYVLVQRIDRGKWKTFGISSASSVLLVVLIILLNFNQVLWIGKYDTELGGRLMPWSYIINTIRRASAKSDANKEEIRLPDARFTDNEKTAVVLVIGESARKADFQLYGYNRPTNPELSKRTDIHVLDARSCDTYTTAGVKAILEYKAVGTLYEIIPNYMFRTGADISWRTSNWGEPPVHIDEYLNDKDLKKMYPDANGKYDEILFTGIADRIKSSKKNKVFIILHTSTNHGPGYSAKYPKSFEKFTPVCQFVENAKDSIGELINAYDNSILYVDHLLNSLIDTLSTIQGWNCAMMYVSDHGESLGESGLFMHGVPVAVAPDCQCEIPFIVWTSSDFRKLKKIDKVIDQHYVFHSVMNLLSATSPVYNPDFDIFERP